MEYTSVILRSVSVVVLFTYSMFAIQYATTIFECKNRNRTVDIVVSIFNTAFIFVGNYLQNPIYITYFVGIAMLTIQFYFLVRGNVRESLFGASIFILHLVCMQMIVMSMMSLVYNCQPYDTINDFDLFSLNILFTFILAIVALTVFKKVIGNDKIRVIMHNKQQSILVTLICIYIVAYSCFDSYAYAIEGNYQYLAITMIGIQFLSISLFYLLISHSIKIGKMSHYKNKHAILKEELHETIKKEEVLKELAYKDDLTGCYTKAYCNSYLDNLIHQHKKEYCIVYIDLDKLKLVNDSFGHNEGDYYIKKVSSTVSAVFGEEDMLARIGGDEFLLLVKDCTEDYVNKKMLEVQRKLLLISSDGLPYTMDISYGVIYVDENRMNETQSQLLNEVDYKMYLHKQSKQNAEVDK